jgi:ankyrin repeat protein
MFAAQHGHLTTIQALLSAKGIDIDAKNTGGETALIIAALSGNYDVVKILVEHGADINQEHETFKNLNDSTNEAVLKSLEFLMNYLAHRQANVGDLRQEAIWASAFATSPIPPKASANAIPSSQSLALDADIKQAQIAGPSLSQISFQASRDNLLQLKLSAVDVVRLIHMCQGGPFDTALVQTLAVAIKLGGYGTDSEHHLIFNALQTSRLIDEYQKSKLCLNSTNINRWQVSGQTLLTRAAQAGDQLLVEALINCGAAHYLPDQHGNNALHAAVKAGKWSVCSHLLALGANPNTSDRNGVSTLPYLAQAFAEGDETTALLVATLLAPLLAKGYRLDRFVRNLDPARSREWTTILEILQSDLNRYGSYLDVLYADAVNLADNNGNTPLMFAAENGILTVLPALVHKGANVNAANNDGWTPLIIATVSGHLQIVQTLLSAKGIDIDTKNSDGATALILAAANGKDDIVKELINNGADVNITDNNGRTPQMWALQGGHQTTAQILLNSTRISNNLTTMV